MVVLKAYFDESGHSQDPFAQHIITVGGGVASLEQWEKAGEEWDKVLGDFKVEVFHANKLAHYQDEFCKSNGWDQQKKKRFHAALMKVMREHVYGFVGAGMPIELYNFLPPIFATKFPDPYYVSFLECIIGVATVAENEKPEAKIDIAFALHQEYSSKAKDAWEWIHKNEACPPILKRHIGSISFDTPERTVQLQIADYISYETHLHWQAEGYREGIPLRWPIQQMKDRFLTLECYDRELIRARFGI